MRFPLVRRSKMEAALESQLGLYNRLMGERDHEIARLREMDRLNRERRHELADSCERFEAELARLRAHFDATCKSKDEAYRVLAVSRDGWRDAAGFRDDSIAMLRARLDSLGLGDADWAHPTPRFSSVSVLADINGVRGELGGLGGDPNGDDPRFNMAMPMGLPVNKEWDWVMRHVRESQSCPTRNEAT